MKSIAEIAIQLRNGKSVRQSSDAGGLPITRIETIADGTINPDRVGFADLQPSDCDGWLLERGDILISHINSTKHLGKCAIYDGEPSELVHGMNLLGMRVDQQKAVPQYIYRMMSAPEFRRQIPRITKNSVNQSSFNISNFKKLEIPLPPLSEQKRIAGILDAADDLRAKRREALAQLDTLLQATFLDMFGGNEPLSELASIADVIDCKHRTPEYVRDGYPVVRPRNVREFGIDFDACVRTSEHEYRDLTENRIPSVGDIVYSRNATFGVASRVSRKVEFAIGQDVCLIVPKAVNPTFLWYQLNSHLVRRQLNAFMSGSTFKRINLKSIRKLKLVLPSANQQNDFERFCNSVDVLKANMQEVSAELDTLFASLQQRAFAGEL